MRRRFRLLSILLAVVFLIALVPPVGAATPAVDQPLTMDEAISLLQLHGIVKGDERGNLNLYSNITRAEAAAIFVRARNMSAFAPQLADLVPFSDARGKWFSGEVAMAYQLGLMQGDPDGRFRPNDQITYAEFLTVLLRMIGQEPSGRWDPAAIMWKAAEVGILPSGVTSSQPAVRQQAFWALASAMTVPLANGRTLLQDFDMVPPDLRVGSVAAETTDESITLTGTATGAYKVLVNGKAATLESRTGAFEAKVDLQMGRNDFTIQAFDRAGNVAQRTVTIERKPKVSTIKIEGPELVPPNSSVKLKITAYDDKGNEVALENATYTLSNKNHQFDEKTSTLKTGSQKGKATLTVTAGSVKGTYTFEVQGPSSSAKALQIDLVNGGRALAPDKEYTVKVQVLDKDGKVVTDDYGREITVTVSGMDDVRVTPTKPVTAKGEATFTIEAEDEGTMTLKVSTSGLDSAETKIQVLDSPRIVLIADRTSLQPDGISSTEIRAALEDDEGKRIVNDDEDIEIELRVRNSDGYLEDTVLIIEEGRSTSRYEVEFVAGFEEGTARITGTVVSDHDYPVQDLYIPIGYGGDDEYLKDDHFELAVSPSKPSVGDEVTVTLRVVDEDGRTKTSGSYAFLIRLYTSNSKDKVVDGIPEGVTFHFEGDPDYAPVYGGKGDWAVVGRTYRGRAKMTLSYDRAGTVYLVPVGVSSNDKAYNPDDGGFGKASSTRSYEGRPLAVRFVETPAEIRFEYDRDEYEDGDKIWVDRNDRVKLVVWVYDEDGDVMKDFDGVVTLTRYGDDDVSRIDGDDEDEAEATVRNGKATFYIETGNRRGSDVYVASIGKIEAEIVIVVD